MSAFDCPCGSGKTLTDCCGRWHSGTAAPSPEALMRSRYSAYSLGLVDYLVATTLPAQQQGLDRAAMAAWSSNSQWLGLVVERLEPLAGEPPRAFVTFSAQWRDAEGEHRQRERSAFVHNRGRWYFIDPSVGLKAGRNDPCPCGSERKFKKCCSDFLA